MLWLATRGRERKSFRSIIMKEQHALCLGSTFGGRKISRNGKKEVAKEKRKK